MVKNILLTLLLFTISIHAENIKLFGVVKSNIGSIVMIHSQAYGQIIHKYYSQGQYVKKGFILAILKPKKAELLNGIGGYKINNIKIISQISGYIVDDFIFEGSHVNNGANIVKVVSNRNKYLSISVPNKLVKNIFKDKEIQVIYNNQKIKTKITQIIPITNPSNDTFEAIAPIKDNKLYIGSVCEIIIQNKRK